jgi:hypothetical protein
MPAGPNERQLSSDAALGIQNGIAISVGFMAAAIGALAWLPELAQRLIGGPLPDVLKWFPAFAVGTLVLYTWQASQRCTVYLTPHGLRIVRGKHQIVVPMNQVAKVERQVVTTSGRRSRSNAINVTFREATPLGASIQFLAPVLHAQSVVDELRKRAGFVNYA